MSVETLLYDVADGIATLTLNRPDRLNAVNGTVIRELVAAFDRADADDGVRAVIVTGAGRAFCWRMLGADHPREAHRLDSLGMWHTGRSADAHEGITSFLETRPPRFTGRPGKDMPPFYPWWTAEDDE